MKRSWEGVLLGGLVIVCATVAVWGAMIQQERMEHSQKWRDLQKYCERQRTSSFCVELDSLSF